MAGLKGVTELKTIDLAGCRWLQNVDGLKGLTALELLNLTRCLGIPAPALRELEAALPDTKITFPDGRIK